MHCHRNPKWLAVETFKNVLPRDPDAAWKKITQMHGVSAAVPQKFYPMLVTFGDLKDPKSVKEVKPDDLAATFGSGTSLKSITLEITDEPVTEGVVEKVVPWVAELRGAIDKSPYDTKADRNKEQAKNFYRNINDGSFRQGFSK